MPISCGIYLHLATSLQTSQRALSRQRPACVALDCVCPTLCTVWVRVTLSGNRRSGFSQCTSLPAPVPFQYSGNLRSSWEGLADTTQQPASGRGAVTGESIRRRREQQRTWVGQTVRKEKWKGDEKEKRLRRPRMQKKEVAECSGRKGRGQRRKEIRRWWCRGWGPGGGRQGRRGWDGGSEIRGFAGAAWTTSDLNGALNPAVAYPDFSSILLTPQTARAASWFPQHGLGKAA